MSLKLVPFESLDAVSYSPSIVTVTASVAVCEIFNVKEWRDLENQVRGRSRSLKMAPFDRPYATFYWSAIEQEAQLSQKDRATLRVIEYFAKSLNVIRNDTVE